MLDNNKFSRIDINRNFLMLFLALLLGTAGVYLANAFIKERIAAFEASHKDDTKMVEVVVPRRDLPRGTRIVADDLATRQIPTQWVHRGTVTESTYRIAEGQRLTYDAEEGKPLLWAHLESGSVPTFSGKLPEGMRALTIPVDEVNSLSGFLQPLDQIDLILTYKPGKEKITIPLLQNVLVLATGIKTVVDKVANNNGARTYRTVTLQVTPKDAKRIVLAREAGSITAVLRHPDDEVLASKASMTVATLFGNKPKPKPRRSVIRKRGIEFIIGGI